MSYKRFFSGLVNNWPAKVLSLAIAIILFVFHRMVTLEERFFSVPLHIENLNTMMPSGSYPRMIMVTIRGETQGIYSIMEDDIEVFVDMENFSIPGVYRIPVQWRKTGTALGIDPLQINVDPSEILFSLDNRISRVVPLNAMFRGQPEPGFVMTSYSLNPDQIIIDGPAGLMATISELSTELIDLGGRQTNFNMTVSIISNDPLILIRGRGVSEFHGTISQIIPVRNIPNLPIVITGLKEGFAGDLELGEGSVHIEGENQEEVLSFVAPPNFLRVDCSGISEPGVYILRIQADIVPNMNIRIDPAEVSIRVIDMGTLD